MAVTKARRPTLPRDVVTYRPTVRDIRLPRQALVR
jgi:hypothetical protein